MTEEEKVLIRKMLRNYLHLLYYKRASSVFETEEEEEVQDILKALSYL